MVGLAFLFIGFVLFGYTVSKLILTAVSDNRKSREAFLNARFPAVVISNHTTPVPSLPEKTWVEKTCESRLREYLLQDDADLADVEYRLDQELGLAEIPEEQLPYINTRRLVLARDEEQMEPLPQMIIDDLERQKQEYMNGSSNDSPGFVHYYDPDGNPKFPSGKDYEAYLRAKYSHFWER